VLSSEQPNTSDSSKALVTERIIEITEQEQSVTFSGIKERPVVSLLRGFSAPVRLQVDRTREDYLQLLCNDDDAFSRWDASQQLAVSIINDLVDAYQNNKAVDIDDSLLQGLRQVLSETDIDKAMLALLLTLPSEAYLCEIAQTIDVEAIHYAHQTLECFLANGLKDLLQSRYQSLNVSEPYQATADAIAKRSLKNTALRYLMLLDEEQATVLCYEQYSQANNMTDNMAALKAMTHSQRDSAKAYQKQLLTAFYERWKNEALVVNQWLMVQATVPDIATLAKVRSLMQHECFSMTNPNKVRSLIGAFTQNITAFHQASGEGYEFLADQIITLNSLNPQVAARVMTPLTRWKKYDLPRQKKMRAALERIQSTPDLSKDVFEVVIKSL